MKTLPFTFCGRGGRWYRAAAQKSSKLLILGAVVKQERVVCRVFLMPIPACLSLPEREGPVGGADCGTRTTRRTTTAVKHCVSGGTMYEAPDR